MKDTNNIVCIITARGGSKRLPGKNIKLLNGKPLIAYAIIAAKGSKYIDRTIVSTESSEIADVALSYGAEVPFVRPAELATDEASSVSVLQHAVQTIEQHGQKIDIMVLVQPTSPLVVTEDIDATIDKLFSSGAPTCVSVSQSGALNGAVYAVRRDALMVQSTVNDPRAGVTLLMPDARSVDVDTEEDFLRAEALLKERNF